MRTLITILITTLSASLSFAIQPATTIKSNALKAGVSAKQFDKAFGYYQKHQDRIRNKGYISFIDFSLSSSKERLFVVNLNTGKVSKFLVSHGQGSGAEYATQFSNTPDSHKSSLGLYVIGTEYVGKHGKSLYMDGLEGSNSKARERNIVMHKAAYVSKNAPIYKQKKYIGRSHGCPAVNPTDWELLRPRLKNGSLILAYNEKQKVKMN